jgi:hypothetical protein
VILAAAAASPESSSSSPISSSCTSCRFLPLLPIIARRRRGERSRLLRARGTNIFCVDAAAPRSKQRGCHVSIVSWLFQFDFFSDFHVFCVYNDDLNCMLSSGVHMNKYKSFLVKSSSIFLFPSVKKVLWTLSERLPTRYLTLGVRHTP